LLSLMSIAGFVMTKMSLAAQLKTQQALVDSKFSSVQEVSSKASTHPNENSHKEMDLLVDKVANDVREAWQEQYEGQTAIMQWPESLSKEVISKFDKYRPIESLPFPLEKDPTDITYRERYRDYVDPLFPELAKIIGANWEATVNDIATGGGGGSAGGLGAPSGMGGLGGMDPGGMMGGSGMGNAATQGPKPLVYWQPASQRELMQSVLWWHNKDKVPSTHEILYTQEDLWIIKGLMDIIKATNGDAQESFQAAIKEIEFLRIGKSAVGRAGTITSLGSTGNMGMGMGMGSGGSGMPMPGGEDGDQDLGSSGGSAPAPGSEGMEGILDGAMNGTGATQSSPDPASGRYVDTAFQPINGDMLRTVVSSGALNPTDAPLAVAKRVPVRMRFVMDQRKLNRLLTECGNANLLFEVRQVRINTEAHGAASGMGGMMGGSGGGRAGPSLGGSAGTPGLGAPEGSMEGSGGSGGGGGSITVGGAKTFDLPVEIYGVVYLFNPVDMNKLGIEKVTADTQIENVGRVSAEESTGLETDKSSTTDPGTAAPDGSATPPGDTVVPPADAGTPATPPATPAVPDGSASGGVAPDGSTPAPATADPGAPTEAGAAAGPGTPAVPALPPAGTN
jgi:hypothetical protein